MEKIVEYIMMNYTWIIGGSIVILLAVIGYYADKTNFGQGYSKDKNEESDEQLIDLSNVKLSSLVEKKETNETTLKDNNVEEIQNQVGIENNNFGTDEVNQQIQKENPSQQSTVSLELNSTNDLNYNLESKTDAEEKEKIEKFNKEFEEILPEKSIIDEQLLDEIENLSFDKTQKLNLSEIPDVDDVELPKIKSMEKIDEDIWKF